MIPFAILVGVFVIGTLVSRRRETLGRRGRIALAAMFAVTVLLPANISSALVGTGLGARGPHYLFFRVPLQLFFIAWTAAFTGGWHASSIIPAR